MILSKIQENKLIEETKRGGQESFDSLFNSYRPAFIAYAQVRIYTGNYPDAEDIVQDIFLPVWIAFQKKPEHGGYNRQKGGFYTWVTQGFLKYRIMQFNQEIKKRPMFRDFFSSEKDEQNDLAPEDLNEERRYELNPDTLRNRIDEWQVREEMFRLMYYAYVEFFKLVFLCGGFPHQQLCFALSKCLYGFGKNSPRGNEGAPRLLHNEFGTVLLKDIPDIFWREYQKISRIDPDILEQCKATMDPLVLRLSCPVRDVFTYSGKVKEKFEHLFDKKIADTTLEDYYKGLKKSYFDTISDWCNKVKKRLRELLGLATKATELDALKYFVLKDDDPIEHQGCKKCKLSHMPPCLSKQLSSKSKK